MNNEGTFASPDAYSPAPVTDKARIIRYIISGLVAAVLAAALIGGC